MTELGSWLFHEVRQSPLMHRAALVLKFSLVDTVVPLSVMLELPMVLALVNLDRVLVVPLPETLPAEPATEVHLVPFHPRT